MLRFQFYWLRRMIRNNTDPIPEETALRWKKRLSVAYALIAWNAFGIIIYQSFNGKADWAAYHGLKTEEELKMTPAQQWSQVLKVDNPVIYRVSGMSLVKIEGPNDDNKDSNQETANQ